MGSIKILQKGITDIPADAIVNAANSGLWAGGGVCGAIFRQAGYDELTAACNAIGHCDEGSAVITPANISYTLLGPRSWTESTARKKLFTVPIKALWNCALKTKFIRLSFP